MVLVILLILRYEWSTEDNRPYRELYDSNDNKIPLPDDYQGTSGYQRYLIDIQKNQWL